MVRGVLALVAAALFGAGVHAQECAAEFSGAQSLRAQGYTLMFRTEPAKIAVGKHFSVELMVCPAAGVPATYGVKVDAYMPEHRHGMNYKPIVKPLGAGRFQADGLMFHMPGRWEFHFDVEAQGRTERLSSSLVLR